MNLFKAELRKFFTIRTWLWLLIGTVAIALIQVAFLLAAAGAHRLPAIRAAMRAVPVSLLVTDAACAEALLEGEG